MIAFTVYLKKNKDGKKVAIEINDSRNRSYVNLLPQINHILEENLGDTYLSMDPIRDTIRHNMSTPNNIDNITIAFSYLSDDTKEIKIHG